MPKRILVVDDDLQVIRFLRIVLEHAGYSVQASSAAEDGYRLACANPPDCMILDVDMPDMDGGELAERLRLNASTSDIPVIFCTGLLGDGEVEPGARIGRHTYVSKPIKPPKLLAHLKAVLGES